MFSGSLLGSICNKNLTAATGNFSSPNYPENYPNGIECTTRITVKPGLSISLSFERFKLNTNRFTTDYVKIFDGSSFVDTHYGFIFPPQFTSKSNSIVVKFKTDSSGTDSGYLATYKTYDRKSFFLSNSLIIVSLPNFFCQTPSYRLLYIFITMKLSKFF